MTSGEELELAAMLSGKLLPSLTRGPSVVEVVVVVVVVVVEVEVEELAAADGILFSGTDGLLIIGSSSTRGALVVEVVVEVEILLVEEVGLLIGLRRAIKPFEGLTIGLLVEDDDDDDDDNNKVASVGTLLLVAFCAVALSGSTVEAELVSIAGSRRWIFVVLVVADDVTLISDDLPGGRRLCVSGNACTLLN